MSLDLCLILADAMPIPPRTCRACERVGFPILPLRAAYGPEPLQTEVVPLIGDPEVKGVPLRPDQPRTLRKGYLYVLLNRLEWQAYQITPEGALRQFRPYQIPREEPLPLTQACIKDHHDIPASFLNIDTKRFSTAWLALANDPWPKEVLDEYLRCANRKTGNLCARFYKLDLKTAREDPASVGIAMTENNLQVQQVLEYAQPTAGDFRSVHGFYTRNHRLSALRTHVRTMIDKHKLPNGVLALVLPDPIGVVQELNAQRLIRYQAMQEWCAEPERRFKFFTSQALLGIREYQDARAIDLGTKEAEREVEKRRQYHLKPQLYIAPLPVLDLETEKARAIKSERADARERLGKRYDEKARQDFQTRFEKTLAGWHKVINNIGEPYASHYQGAAFQLAGRADYSATNERSVDLFIRMMGQCLAGGPTEPMNKDKIAATQRLWKAQLEDRKSLLYQALTAKEKGWFDQVSEALDADERTRVYHGIKTLIGTEQGRKLMIEPVQAAIGQLLAATATASNALGDHISAQATALVRHLHREAWLRYSGVQVTQITVSLKVGEYLTLLNEVLYEGTERFIKQLDQQFRKPAERKVRAMLLSNRFTPALASSHGVMIDIKLWTLESAEDLQNRLGKLRAGLGDGVGDALRQVSIGAAALTGGMEDFARHLSISGETARLLARDSMHSMRNAGKAGALGGFNFGLAVGSLWFQQDSLRRSYENMLKTVGEEHPEAVAAVMSASFGVMGASVEAVGGAIQMIRPGLTVTVASGAAGGVGSRVLQYGGAMVSMASAMEALQYALAAGRTHGTGDEGARNAYVMASAAAASSALAGVLGSVGPAGVALFPLGLAVLLGFLAYGLAVWARKLESQPLELWARYSVWGLPEEYRRWKDPQDFDTAIGALNATLLGLSAQLDITGRAERQGSKVTGFGGIMEFRFVLPRFDADASRYEWALWAYRTGDDAGGLIAGGRTGGINGPSPVPAIWKRPGYKPETTAPVIEHNVESGTLDIRGAIAYSGVLDFHALQMEVSYWPDKSDESGVARLVVKEDKLDQRRPWSFL